MKKQTILLIMLGIIGCWSLDAQNMIPMRSWHAGSPLGNCVINEDQDQEIKISIQGNVKEEFEIKIYGPDNNVIKAEKIKPGTKPMDIVIPADQKTGQYKIIWDGSERKGALLGPMSNLPEVYYREKGFIKQQQLNYYIAAPDKTQMALSNSSSKSIGKITKLDGTLIAEAKTPGEEFEAVIPGEGAIFSGPGRYVTISAPVIMAFSADKLFVLTPETIEFLKGAK